VGLEGPWKFEIAWTFDIKKKFCNLFLFGLRFFIKVCGRGVVDFYILNFL